MNNADHKQETPDGVDVQRLVLCRVFDKHNRLVKRWLKPSTPALIPCTECGFQDTAYAKHAATHVCLDCYSCKANVKFTRRDENTEIR